ncbi:MAG: PKD domain-containing protein [Saprospiraceae bacterium]|nr:PKD domain-containing protein [Saprospiraceae bacterium]
MNFKTNNINILLLALLLSVFACEPFEEEKSDLGAPPNPSFSLSEGENANQFILTNTTDGAFLTNWDLGNGVQKTGEQIVANYPLMGEYEITMTTFNRGGSASTSQTVNVAQDAPFDCVGNELYEFLSNCTSKTWKLLPGPGALWVGPADGSGSTWWSNSEDDVAARSCAWDDTWTFTGDEQMIYETNGDIWGEDYMGFNFECVDEALLSETFAPWGSGTHFYSLTEGAPNQLQVVGLGAFIGLPKAANGAEVSTPQSSITYDILKMENDGTKDILEVEVNYTVGIWRFTLVSE